MKNYLKYILVIILTLFTFYYTDKVIELSDKNNVILKSVNAYAESNNINCIEGSISDKGITLSYEGKLIDTYKSYNNMKGSSFNTNLIEYKVDKCILNKENNIDKYIIKGNSYEKKVSLVIDVIDKKYINGINNVFILESSEVNYLIDYNKIEDFKNKNILIKTNTNNIKKIKNKIDNFYCVKYNNYDVIDICKKEKINSINILYYINKNLLLNTKHILNNGIIIFIKENEYNYNELISTLKYIKSMGYRIVSIDELL